MTTAPASPAGDENLEARLARLDAAVSTAVLDYGVDSPQYDAALHAWSRCYDLRHAELSRIER